jgi:hypothetical protein
VPNISFGRKDILDGNGSEGVDMGVSEWWRLSLWQGACGEGMTLPHGGCLRGIKI